MLSFFLVLFSIFGSTEAEAFTPERFVDSNASASAMRAFCRQEAVDEDLLYSEGTLRFLRSNLSTLQLNEFPYACLFRLKERLIQKREEGRTQACRRQNRRCEEYLSAYGRYEEKIEGLLQELVSDRQIMIRNALQSGRSDLSVAQLESYLATGKTSDCGQNIGLSRADPALIANSTTQIKESFSSACKKLLLEQIRMQMEMGPKRVFQHPSLCGTYSFPACIIAQREIEQLNGFIRAIGMGLVSEFGGGAEELKCLNNIDLNNVTAFVDEISRITDALQRRRHCEAPLRVRRGETVVLEATNRFTEATSYALRQGSNGEVQALIDIKFQSENQNLDLAAFARRYQSCLDEARPFLKGPEGQQLEIRLLTDAEKERAPRSSIPSQNVMEVHPTLLRENTGNISLSSSCPAILHETLHLLGLEDEYADSEFPCRITPKTNTIMGSHLSATEESQVKVCDCPAESTCGRVFSGSNQYLKKAFLGVSNGLRDSEWEERFGPTKCEIVSIMPFSRASQEVPVSGFPVSSSSPNKLSYYSCFPDDGPDIMKCINYECTFSNGKGAEAAQALVATFNKSPERCPPSSTLARMEMPNFGAVVPVSYDNGILTIPPQEEVKSLLAPAHFNRILSGTCPETNAQYNICSGQAYATGMACRTSGIEECKNDLFYLGISR